MLSPQPNSDKSAPLPIDWVVPTSGCRLAIRGTGKKLGYWDIQSAQIRDFIQPSIFPADLEIWPPESRSEIAWLHYKGDVTKKPTKEHPVEVDRDDWDNEGNRYRIDLFVEGEKGGELEEVRSVMPPTNSKVFWDSTGPFGKFDGVHAMSAWQFTSDTECKYYFVGVMSFIWDVPGDLDPERTYRFKFTINSHEDEEHISGPFRIQPGGDDESLPMHIVSKNVTRRWMGYAFALFVVGVMVLWIWKHRAGVMELE